MATATTTTTISSTSSSKEIATKIKSLLLLDQNDTDAERFDELRRIFALLIQQGDLIFYTNSSIMTSNINSNNNNNNSTSVVVGGVGAVGATNKWNIWLQKQYKECIKQLLKCIRSGNKRTAVRTLWGFIACTPLICTSVSATCTNDISGNTTKTTTTITKIVNAELLYQWLQAMISMTDIDVRKDKSMYHLLESELLQYDVQYYTLRAITRWSNEQYNNKKIRNIHNNNNNNSNNDNNKSQKTKQIQEQADRMLSILMMIPFPTSQSVLDNPTTSKYLFPPPMTSTTTHKNNNHDLSDNSDDNDDDNDDDEYASSGDSTDSDSEGEKDDNSNRESEQPPQKKQKTLSKIKNKSNNRNHQFAYQNVKYHLRALTKAWMAILRLPVSTTCLKRALPFLSSHVLPKIQQPLKFADLFIQAYSSNSSSTTNATTTTTKVDDEEGEDQQEKKKQQDGESETQSAFTNHQNTIIPLLALDGLFYLMTQHRLEYPQFYKQLYSILKPKLFYVKYRNRFFVFLQKCLLRNEMLPAHIIAAFMKRLLLCAIMVPPSSILFILSLISNLLRQHEECAALIHRTSTTSNTTSTTTNKKRENNNGDMEDVYDAVTDDPVQSHALQSSLWELHALEQHYHPAVATLAKSIGREDPKSPMLNLDEMTQHTYTSLIEQERKRKVKKNGDKRKRGYEKMSQQIAMTSVTFIKPSALFPSNDVFAGIVKVPSTITTTTTTTTTTESTST